MQPILSKTILNQSENLISRNNLLSVKNSEIQVIRRNGSWTELDISRIRYVVEWATTGLEANHLALEAGLTTRLRHGITTREIQENLINCALQMCSLEEPDWR